MSAPVVYLRDAQADVKMAFSAYEQQRPADWLEPSAYVFSAHMLKNAPKTMTCCSFH